MTRTLLEAVKASPLRPLFARRALAMTERETLRRWVAEAIDEQRLRRLDPPRVPRELVATVPAPR